MNTEPISPLRAAWRASGKSHREAELDTRRYWRKVKRNHGQKAKTLRSHRRGRS